MNGKRFLRSLRVRNFLSYGAEAPEFACEPLNVFIGPNTSGKSNLLEAIGLLAAAPTDLTKPITRGGGVGEWLWKGVRGNPVAEIETTVYFPSGTQPLRYRVSFTQVGQRIELIDETVEDERKRHAHEDDVFFYYRYQRGRPVLNVRGQESSDNPGYFQRQLRREDLLPDQSVLSQRKDPNFYPEITYLATQFAAMRLYREWEVGRYTPPRLPQPADLPVDFLEEDWRNLGLVLNDLQHQSATWRPLTEYMRRFCDDIESISVKVYGGTVQVFLHERDRGPIPATRLSDGTLRFLCLLAVLLHPSPPPVVCLEEPEIGLHPDIIPAIAELLREASQRTQLFVTTHSDELVTALSESPEAVIVCERGPDGTTLQRLDPERLRKWLAQYTLGDLWRMGEIGGNRW